MRESRWNSRPLGLEQSGCAEDPPAPSRPPHARNSGDRLFLFVYFEIS